MAKSSGVLYGSSKTYKTWNLGLLSKYIYSKTKGKPIRWVTADGGGIAPVQKFVDAGIIEPLVITNDPLKIAIMRKIVEGYWPIEISKDGERLTTKMAKESITECGGYVIEGITSIAEKIQDLYRGKTVGMKPAYSEEIKAVLTDEKGQLLKEDKIGAFSQDSYGLVQTEMRTLINYSWTLPVDYIWWSGHEAVAEDDDTRKMVRGVALVGKAATPRIGKDIGYMIHAYRVDIGSGFETRYYFTSHPDNVVANQFWEASSRLPGDDLAKLLQDKAFEYGYFVPSFTEGLDVYIEFEENLLSQGTNELMEWVKEIKGS